MNGGSSVNAMHGKGHSCLIEEVEHSVLEDEQEEILTRVEGFGMDLPRNGHPGILEWRELFEVEEPEESFQSSKK